MRDPVTFAFDEDESLPTIVARLAADARALAGAEIAVQKAKIGDTIAAYRNAAIFFAAAGILGLAGLIALLVGAIMALSTVVHPGWATLIVVGATIVIAGILAMVGKSQLRGSEDVA